MTDFDKTKPAGSDKIRLSDEMIRDNWSALEDTLSAEHVFPANSAPQTRGRHNQVTLVGKTSDPAGLTDHAQFLFRKDLSSVRVILPSGDTLEATSAIPAGTKMLFKQSSAPAGWTFVAEDHDRMLLNTNNEGEGGNTGGSWTISGFGFSVHGHTLTIDEIPSHKHVIPWGEYTGQGFNPPYGTVGNNDRKGTNGGMDYDNTWMYSSPEGGGGSHGHGFSWSHNGSWRPAYTMVITCTKD